MLVDFVYEMRSIGYGMIDELLKREVSEEGLQFKLIGFLLQEEAHDFVGLVMVCEFLVVLIVPAGCGDKRIELDESKQKVLKGYFVVGDNLYKCVCVLVGEHFVEELDVERYIKVVGGNVLFGQQETSEIQDIAEMAACHHLQVVFLCFQQQAVVLRYYLNQKLRQIVFYLASRTLELAIAKILVGEAEPLGQVDCEEIQQLNGTSDAGFIVIKNDIIPGYS